MADKVGRNDPCPCGSRRKYKQCCLPNDERKKRSRISINHRNRYL